MNGFPGNPDYVMSPSGLILSEQVAESRYASKMPTGIDMFSGAGGFSLGFKKSGFRMVAAVEYSCEAAITYMTNLCRYGEFKIHFIEDSDGERLEKAISKLYKEGGLDSPFPVAGGGWISHMPRSVPGTEHIFIGDIRKLTGARLLKDTGYARGEIDCVMGGPPCQGFSTAGKRNVMDPRNSLVFDFARLVLEIDPKTMCMENVPNMLNMTTPEGVPIIDALCRILEDGSFMTADALKKAVAQQTGSVGVLRGKTPKKKDKASREKQDKPAAAENTTLDLFGQAGAECSRT